MAELHAVSTLLKRNVTFCFYKKMRNDQCKSSLFFFVFFLSRLRFNVSAQNDALPSASFRLGKKVLSDVSRLMKYDFSEWGLWLLVKESLDFGSMRTD